MPCLLASTKRSLRGADCTLRPRVPDAVLPMSKTTLLEVLNLPSIAGKAPGAAFIGDLSGGMTPSAVLAWTSTGSK